MSSTVVPFAPEHAEGLWPLYAAYFGDFALRKFQERVHWQFEANPWADERPAWRSIALHDGRAVGFYAAYPIPIWIRGERILAMAGTDFVVAKGHRQFFLRLFSERNKLRPGFDTGFNEVLESFLGRMDFELLPESREDRVFRLGYRDHVRAALVRRLPKGLRWAARMGLDSLVMLVHRPTGPRPRAAIAPEHPERIAPLNRYMDEYEHLWRSVRGEVDACVDRAADYMNWRYIDSPFRSLRSFGYRDARGRLRGVIVIGHRAHLDASRARIVSREGELFECIVSQEDLEVARDLLRHAVRELARDRVDAIRTRILHPGLAQVLDAEGFERTPPRRHRVALLPEKGDSLLGGRWLLSSGDGDQAYWSTV